MKGKIQVFILYFFNNIPLGNQRVKVLREGFFMKDFQLIKGKMIELELEFQTPSKLMDLSIAHQWPLTSPKERQPLGK